MKPGMIMTSVGLLLASGLALASSQALAQSVEQCELNGRRIPNDFSARMIAGESGMVRCHLAGKVTREEEIKDGKWAGLRKVYHSGGELTEEMVDQNGSRDGVQRVYYPSGVLRAERTIRNNADTVGRVHTFYPSGKPESIAFYEHGLRESIQYAPTGCIRAVHCETQRSRLPEMREICGFGQAPVETRLCDAVETYASGVKIRYTRYSERYPEHIRSQMAIERGVMRFKSFYRDGKLESESEEAVDAAGNPRKPAQRTLKEYDRHGRLRGRVQLDRDLDTQDFWNESGKKLREVRSVRARKDGIDVIVVTTRTFDEQGRVAAERQEHRRSATVSGTDGAPQRSQPGATGRLRYQPVVECVDAGGRTSFRLGRCPARGPGGAVTQVKHEPRSTPANWAEVKERWAISGEQLLAYEKDCAQGNQMICDTLHGLRHETPATFDLRNRDTEKKCRQGDEFACEMLVVREELLSDLMRRCEAGSKETCKRLSNLSQ